MQALADVAREEGLQARRLLASIERLGGEIERMRSAFRERYNQSPTSSQGPAVPPRGTGPVTRSASAAARSEDIGGGAYSGGLDRDDGGGDVEVNTGAASGKSIPKLEEEVERLQELVWEWEDSVQRADHPVKLEDRIRRRYDAIQKLERKKEELKAARARLEQSVQGRGPQYKGKQVVAPPGPSRLNPYPDEEEEDVLQALTSLSARAPDKSSSSGQTTSAGGPKAGGTRAGCRPWT
eukprot:jgi/Mesvir1/1315/Mv22538-RA.1